jgi:acetyltransferase
MAAKALAALTRYNVLRSRKSESIVLFNDIDRARAGSILKEVLQEGRHTLSSAAAFSILDCYGIPVADFQVAKSSEEVGAIAEKLGFPVVVKAEAENLIHKSDVGGVAINLTDAEAVTSAAALMKKRIDADDLSFFLHKYIPDGMEVIIGAKEETGLGHIIVFGLGGVLVELLKDVTFEITPVSAGEAQEMLHSIKTYPLLAGYREKKGVAQQQLIEVIQRISQLVTDLPMIKEIDLNPIIAYEDKVVTVDASIII